MVQPIIDEQNFAVGGGVQPFDLNSTSLLSRADKSLFFALDFFTYVIRTYPGPALLEAATAGAGLKDTKGLPVQNAVEQAYSFDIVPYLPSAYIRFPCLVMYRKEAKYDWHSLGYLDDDCKFDLLYILPPMNAGQANGMLPILRGVETALRQKCVQSFDPNYAPPGGQLGQTPWGLGFAAVEEIGFERGSRGHLPVGNEIFPFLQMSGFVVERDMPLPAQNKFAGGDVTADIYGGDGSKISPFIEVSTQSAPTLTSVSPSAGSIAGGTGVSLTGTLFLTGTPAVMFGNRPATNVVRVSATSVTCVTPAMDGPGPRGITLIQRDGQSANLPAAFTYTSP